MAFLAVRSTIMSILLGDLQHVLATLAQADLAGGGYSRRRRLSTELTLDLMSLSLDKLPREHGKCWNKWRSVFLTSRSHLSQASISGCHDLSATAADKVLNPACWPNVS